jgi:hypothetical protein
MPFWLVCILHMEHSFLVCVVNEFCVSKHHHHHHYHKGTVCIGTIGLRGSTTEDNAAAAVEASKVHIYT